MLLQGKIALVTGTNRGIGKAILSKFAMEGADVFAHAREMTEEHEIYCRQLAREYKVKVYPIYFDVSNEAEIQQGVKSIFAIVKRIDILINNIGAILSTQLFQMTSINTMRREFEINFFSQLYLTQYVSRRMMHKKMGSIVNISSCAGLDGNTGMISYVSEKAAMIGATKRLAIELGEYNIRVNSVAPGLTNTSMGNMMISELEEKAIEHQIFKRKAEPDEIADAVLFLASDMSKFITGQVLRVDGGMLN